MRPRSTVSNNVSSYSWLGLLLLVSSTWSMAAMTCTNVAHGTGVTTTTPGVARQPHTRTRTNLRDTLAQLRTALDKLQRRVLLLRGREVLVANEGVVRARCDRRAAISVLHCRDDKALSALVR